MLKETLDSNKDLIEKIYVNNEDSTCFSLKHNDGRIEPIIYVFRIDDSENSPNPFTGKTKNLIETYYEKLDSNGKFILYKLKEIRN